MKYKHPELYGTTPSGDNQSPAMKSHIDSYLYDLYFPTGVSSDPPVGQIRETMKILYGKVDTRGYVVLPRQDSMFEYALNDGSKSHMVLGPVRKCLVRFIRYYEKLRTRQKLSEESMYYKEIKPTKTFVNQSSIFGDYISGLNTDIVESIIALESEETLNIGDYHSFEEYYIKKMSEKISQGENCTFSEFCLSKYSSPLQTGLVIDLSDEDCSDDRAKYEGFLSDENYRVFKSAANRFGFRVDKHIPWRLYYDLASPYVKEQLEFAYKINTVQEFFENFYERVHVDNVMSIGDQIHDAYLELCEKSPAYMKPERCPLSGGTSIVIKEREKMSTFSFNRTIPERHKIRLYAYFRAKERRLPMSQNRFDKLVEAAYSMYVHRNESRSSDYIESAFTDRTRDLIIKNRLTKRIDSDKVTINKKQNIKF